ncbi:hypothetical protein CF327_g5110 [Tilletia walkeri]|nr:hypothetical protein CF327_g5110 [Tilletia walkeri]
MSSAATAFAAPQLDEPVSLSRPTTPFAMFFKSPAAVLRKGTSNAPKRPALTRPHTTSGTQLPLHLSSYVSFCAYSSQWDPSIYGAGNPCPPPPRGTLNDSKLAFLDWQMALIKFQREKENAEKSAAAATALQTVDSMDTDAVEVIGDDVAVEDLVQESALRAGVKQLEVPEETLVRTRKPVQRLSAFPPRPHTTDGSITTYVPKIPGRFYAVAQPQDDEPQFQPVTMANIGAVAAQDAEPSTLMMMNAVVVPVHGEDTEDSSAVSTPSGSDSGTASDAQSIMGESPGSEWAATSFGPEGSRHRATSSVATTAFDSSERRYSSRAPVVSQQYKSRDGEYDLAELGRTTRLVEAQLAAQSQLHFNQNKPLPPLGVGPNLFFAPPPFEPSHYSDLAPVRESSFATPQQRHRSTSSQTMEVPDRARLGRSNPADPEPQQAPRSASALSTRRSRSLLARAVSRFRPTTPSAAVDREAEADAVSPPKPTSRLSIFSNGREPARKRSRSIGAHSFLGDGGNVSQQQRQDGDAEKVVQQAGPRSEMTSPPRPSSRMSAVLSLRSTFRRGSVSSSNVRPSKVSVQPPPQQRVPPPPQQRTVPTQAETSDEVADERGARRPTTSMSTRQRSGNLFKAASSWLKSRSRVDEYSSSRSAVRNSGLPDNHAGLFTSSSAVITAA